MGGRGWGIGVNGMEENNVLEKVIGGLGGKGKSEVGKG